MGSKVREYMMGGGKLWLAAEGGGQSSIFSSAEAATLRGTLGRKSDLSTPLGVLEES